MGRQLPKRCRYGDKSYAVLDWERRESRARDLFLIERPGEPAFWVRRSRVTFTGSLVSAVQAVDEALDLLGVLGVEEVAS